MAVSLTAWSCAPHRPHLPAGGSAPDMHCVHGAPNSRPAGPPAESNLPHLEEAIDFRCFLSQSTIGELDPVIRPKINIEPLFPEAYCFHGFGALFVLFFCELLLVPSLDVLCESRLILTN